MGVKLEFLLFFLNIFIYLYSYSNISSESGYSHVYIHVHVPIYMKSNDVSSFIYVQVLSLCLLVQGIHCLYELT